MSEKKIFNVCICISGQLRGDFENLKALKKQISTFNENIRVSVIISTWNYIGNKVEGVIGFNQLSRVFDPELLSFIPSRYIRDGIWRYFPNTFEKLKSTGDGCENVRNKILEIFPDCVLDIEEPCLNLEFNRPAIDKNSLKMLYKRWRCNEIKKKVEKNSEEFDLVVVARPDLKLSIDKIEGIAENTVYIPSNKSRVRYINDTYAYGDSPSIDYYCELFHKSMVEKKWKGIHLELYFHLKLGVVRVENSVFLSSRGLLINKLMKWEDVKGDNKFIDSLYSKKLDLNILEEDERASYFFKRFYDVDMNDMIEKIRALLRTDICLFDLNQIPPARLSYIEFSIFKFIDDFGIEVLRDLVNKEIMNAKLDDNKIINKNLSLLISSQLRENIKVNLKKVDVDNKNWILNVHDVKGMPDDIADDLVKKAGFFEKNDPALACHIYKLAQQIRPNGPKIKRKLSLLNKSR